MEEQIESMDTVSAARAAEELGTTQPRILMLLRKGVLKGNQEGGEWFVTRESLDCLPRHGGDLEIHTTCLASCGRGACGGHR
jgi:hypothetical protein